MARFKALASSATIVLAGYFGADAARANVAISSQPTQNMDCESGVCTATAKKAVLNASDLVGMLASGNVTVQGSIAKSIEIDQQRT